MTHDLLRHGTYTAYARWDCRCRECVAYQNDRVRRNRAERKATGRLSHGTRSAWDAGCRCESCLATKRSAEQRYLANPGARARHNERVLANYHRRAREARIAGT